MKLKTLIEKLSKFDQDCDVEIWVDDSDGFDNIGFNLYTDMDGNSDNKTVQIHIGDHGYTNNPNLAKQKVMG